ncbi:MAG TPA: DMT family transporter [Perlabentimonas sp.]|nr:DMT family transporter [Bacteroidales bacterium]MDD4673013.1 DMT family transporter [Bacteroidales bacterium]MDY0348359.1 DMT family transporter [Tenuifilaceae bacterium]HZJ73284.1 DMT family transporter [Perlabentimonas sp.]
MLNDFILAYKGELAALITAFFWAITAIAFESAGKKIGSLQVNIIRLTMAFIFLSILSWVSRGIIFPVDASIHSWVWLSISGLVGFVLGDLMLFQAYVVVGARISMLIMALAPAIAAFIGWVWLGETITPKQGLAMLLTFLGIAMVILQRDTNNPEQPKGRKKVKFSYPIAGLLLAFGGAVGQGGGLVLSKYGMGDYDVFSAVQIRVLTGIIGFAIIFTFLGRWKKLGQALKNQKALGRISIGAFFGPFLGVSFSLWAIKFTTTGVASALMSIVPVLIIPFSVLIMKEKFNTKELLGAVVTIMGVFLFFL